MDEQHLKKAARYMGSPLTDENRPLLLSAWDKAVQKARPMKIIRKVAFSDAADGIVADGLLLLGNATKRHLKGCSLGYLFAATLGSPMDEAIRMESLLSPVGALALNACASAILEAYLDELCHSLSHSHSGGDFLTPRFSPGYGDLPLSVQADFLNLIEARRIGLYVTSHLMMTPEKSVTALVGITRDAQKACDSNCTRCGNVPCPFREGPPCV